MKTYNFGKATVLLGPSLECRYILATNGQVAIALHVALGGCSVDSAELLVQGVGGEILLKSRIHLISM